MDSLQGLNGCIKMIRSEAKHVGTYLSCSTQEAGAGGLLCIQGQLEQHSHALSQIKPRDK